MVQMTKFEIGKTYTHNFAGDYNACVAWKVLKRTDKSITIESGNSFGHALAFNNPERTYIMANRSYSVYRLRCTETGRYVTSSREFIDIDIGDIGSEIYAVSVEYDIECRDSRGRFCKAA
jgi:hypothetical protein